MPTLASGQAVDLTLLRNTMDENGNLLNQAAIPHGLAANKPSNPALGDRYFSTDTGVFSFCHVAGSWTDIAGGADEKAKVSSDDSASGYLEDKIVAIGLAKTTINPGGSETLQIAPYTGAEMPWPGRAKDVPSGWLLEAGQAVSRSTYAALFAVLCPAESCTITIASPAVINANNHGYGIGDRVRFETTGSLPTGLSTGTDYYIISAGFTANSFQVSTSFGGAAVNTSGSQSGNHTVRQFNHGAGDGSTTFNLPDARGRVFAGLDNMGGTSANRITDSKGDTMSQGMGAETHTLTVDEMPAHTHNYDRSQGGFDGPDGMTAYGHVNVATSSTGGGAAHNNVQPTAFRNWIIKT